MPQEFTDDQHLIVNNGNFTLLWIFNHRWVEKWMISMVDETVKHFLVPFFSAHILSGAATCDEKSKNDWKTFFCAFVKIKMLPMIAKQFFTHEFHILCMDYQFVIKIYESPENFLGWKFINIHFTTISATFQTR